MAYDPASTGSLSRDVARELLVQPLGPLPPEARFPGAGVYAIYYKGNFPLYLPLSDPKGKKGPIYIGKSRPAATLTDAPLYARLREHAKSIEEVANLNLSDFMCRHLVLVNTWISPSEDFLGAYFKPLWNRVVKGFGNHPVGGPRGAGQISRWDALHPGRAGAASGQQAWAEKADTEIAAHFKAHPPRRAVP
jgi:Eco29kI restriction endonuclease